MDASQRCGTSVILLGPDFPVWWGPKKWGKPSPRRNSWSLRWTAKLPRQGPRSSYLGTPRSWGLPPWQGSKVMPWSPGVRGAHRAASGANSGRASTQRTWEGGCQLHQRPWMVGTHLSWGFKCPTSGLEDEFRAGNSYFFWVAWCVDSVDLIDGWRWGNHRPELILYVVFPFLFITSLELVGHKSLLWLWCFANSSCARSPLLLQGQRI